MSKPHVKLSVTAPHPLAALRAQRGWSQQMLATEICEMAKTHKRRSGVNRSRVCDWEAGRLEPSAHHQKLMAEIFDVPWDIAQSVGWPDWLPSRPDVPPVTRHGALTAIRLAVGTYAAAARVSSYSWPDLVRLAERIGDTRIPAHGAPRDPFRYQSFHDQSNDRHNDGQCIDGLDDWLEAGVRAVLQAQPRSRLVGPIDAYLSAVAQRIEQHAEQTVRDSDPTDPVLRRLFAAAAHLSRAAAASAHPVAGRAVAQRYGCAAVHTAAHAARRDLVQQALADLALLAIGDGEVPTALQLLHHVAPSNTMHVDTALLDVAPRTLPVVRVRRVGSSAVAFSGGVMSVRDGADPGEPAQPAVQSAESAVVDLSTAGVFA